MHPQISQMKNNEMVDKPKNQILCFNVFNHGSVDQMYVGHIPIGQKAWNSFFASTGELGEVKGSVKDGRNFDIG